MVAVVAGGRGVMAGEAGCDARRAAGATGSEREAAALAGVGPAGRRDASAAGPVEAGRGAVGRGDGAVAALAGGTGRATVGVRCIAGDGWDAGMA